MKANEMPEKIYLFDYNDAMVTPLEGDTVYVREDAFIEKAAGWLSDNTLSGLCLDLGNAEIVREFVDNFKNFMKQ